MKIENVFRKVKLKKKLGSLVSKIQLNLSKIVFRKLKTTCTDILFIYVNFNSITCQYFFVIL